MTTAQAIRDITPLEHGRVRFTPLQMDNIYTHFRWNNDPELNRLDSEVPYEEETFGEFKKRFEQMCYNPPATHRDFEIHAEDGTLIGVAYVSRISTYNRHGLLGITIGERDYWGRGYGRESLNLLLDYCFSVLELHRVSAETFEYNTAWRELVEGMGFVKEGTAREYLHRDGRFWDKDNYALLRREYAEQREGPIGASVGDVEEEAPIDAQGDGQGGRPGSARGERANGPAPGDGSAMGGGAIMGSSGSGDGAGS
jgi:RimJ/RimL family protein N-acetyltransferase